MLYSVAHSHRDGTFDFEGARRFARNDINVSTFYISLDGGVKSLPIFSCIIVSKSDELPMNRAHLFWNLALDDLGECGKLLFNLRAHLTADKRLEQAGKAFHRELTCPTQAGVFSL